MNEFAKQLAHSTQQAMTCATCQSWALKTSPLARQGMAPCANGKRWEYLPPASTCDAHKPLEQAAAETRAVWLARLDEKHNKGTK